MAAFFNLRLGIVKIGLAKQGYPTDCNVLLARHVTNPLQRKGVVTSKTNIYDSTKVSRAKSWLYVQCCAKEMQTEFAQYCKKPQDLAKDFGGMAGKTQKKFVNLKIVSYI